MNSRRPRKSCKKNLSVIFLLFVIPNAFGQASDGLDLVESNFAFAQEQLSLALDAIGDSHLNPRSTNEDGSLHLVKSGDWTSGFFPGNLWMIYEYSGDEKWRTAARKFTANVEEEQHNGTTHDMGFKMYCSVGNGYRLTNDARYKEILLQSARTLVTRFNEKVGCIRSWDHNSDRWQFPVIIDNLMNLELLFWATKVSGDSSYYKIALAHANTTLKNHYRSDNSSWHVIDYDTSTGAILNRHTHQGYSHDSAWSRGQAWGLYGFTMCYRETGDDNFLQQARKIADFILSHKNLPEDSVPYWDFDAPNIPDEQRDASAAAIICSALYELSDHLGNNGSKYRNAADKILASLSTPKYRAQIGGNNNFLLMHSVGSKPANSEVDTPLIYADYYFLEANLRKNDY
jgi:rhamnogalacturonyl hydrolase YesR